MNEEMFQEWLENPATKHFLKYLEDKRKETGRVLGEDIAFGASYDENEGRRIAEECATLMYISDIDFEQIDSFYHPEKPEEET